MGFFNSSAAGPAANIEDLLEDNTLNIYEGMSIMEAAYAGIAESEMNWNMIMEAVAMSEMEEMSTSGSDYSVVAEAGFFSSVVSFFKKVWEKIKSLFKKFMVMLGSLIGKDKAFAKKHGDTIRAAIKNIPADAEIKGYNFTTEKLHTSITSATTGLVDWVNAINKDNGNLTLFDAYNLDGDSYDASDANEKMRGVICTGMPGHSASMTDSEMRQAAFEQARGDEDTPDDIKIDGGLVAGCLSALESGDKAKRDASKLYSTQEKDWKTIMKQAEKYNTDQYKKFDSSADEQTKAAANTRLKKLSNALALCKSRASAIQALCGVYLQAVKDEYSQCRRVCVKVVTYKSTGEGARISHYSEGAAFAGLNLI